MNVSYKRRNLYKSSTNKVAAKFTYTNAQIDCLLLFVYVRKRICFVEWNNSPTPILTPKN